MEMTISRKIYIGSGEAGKRLSQAIDRLAQEHCHGNVSRFMIWTICKKYGINPRTGEPLKKGEEVGPC